MAEWRSRISTALFSIALITSTHGSEQGDIAVLYKRALAGDKPAVRECIARLERVLQVDSGNQLARVYLGSSYTLRSRDLGYGPGKLEALKLGLRVMDEAIRAAPDDGHVRLVRALTTDSLPFFLGQRQSTRDDFAALVAMAKKNSRQFSDGDLQTIYFAAGNRARADGDRRRAFNLWQEAARHPADRELDTKVKTSLAQSQ